MDTVTLAKQEREKQGSKVDTVTLAKQERNRQGPYEAEISYGGEADLHKHLVGCVKNPGHQEFVPVDQFNVDHLPPGCHDNDLVDMVRAMSDLTVRVSVKYVSERRPETLPGTVKPFPSYKVRGARQQFSQATSDMMRTGTGWVSWVDIYPLKWGSSRTCECQECLNSSTPKTQFAEIRIRTAAHVVYDELEAAHTTCHLFFDKSDSSIDSSGVLALSDWVVVTIGNCGDDWCEMKHLTHDLDLGEMLHKMQWCRGDLWEKVLNRYREQEESNLLAWYKLTIIVSHPHGCSKQISVGYCTSDVNIEEGCVTGVRYTTSTCPGSSGAPVFLMGDEELWISWTRQVHCGNCQDDKNLNFSDYNRPYYHYEVNDFQAGSRRSLTPVPTVPAELKSPCKLQ